MNLNLKNTYKNVRKGSDWIRLVFAHPFPLNSGAPISSANFISDGKVQLSPYLAILIIELAQLMGAPLFMTNGWAQSNCLSSQTLYTIYFEWPVIRFSKNSQLTGNSFFFLSERNEKNIFSYLLSLGRESFISHWQHIGYLSTLWVVKDTCYTWC